VFSKGLEIWSPREDGLVCLPSTRGRKVSRMGTPRPLMEQGSAACGLPALSCSLEYLLKQESQVVVSGSPESAFQTFTAMCIRDILGRQQMAEHRALGLQQAEASPCARPCPDPLGLLMALCYSIGFCFLVFRCSGSNPKS
jgi:hypothetical protein